MDLENKGQELKPKNTELENSSIFCRDSISGIDFENIYQMNDNIITDDNIIEMKNYFFKFFKASENVVNEIFSVKDNIIQHPIYSFKARCLICDQYQINHLKDERGDIFIKRKEIKFQKNANVFNLLNESLYMENYKDQNFNIRNSNPESSKNRIDINDSNILNELCLSDTDFENNRDDYNILVNLEFAIFSKEMKNFLDDFSLKKPKKSRNINKKSFEIKNINPEDEEERNDSNSSSSPPAAYLKKEKEITFSRNKNFHETDQPKINKDYLDTESEILNKEKSRSEKGSFHKILDRKSMFNLHAKSSNNKHIHFNLRKSQSKLSIKLEKSKKSVNFINTNHFTIKKGFNLISRKTSTRNGNIENIFKFSNKNKEILNNTHSEVNLHVKNFNQLDKNNEKDNDKFKINEKENSSKFSQDNLLKNFKRTNKNVLVKKVPHHKIYDKKSLYENNNNFCDICLSSFYQKNKEEEIITLECGHFYCKVCIKLFIVTTISKWNFKNNLENSTCPKPVCSKIISQTKIEFILKDDEVNMKKFKKYLNILYMLEHAHEIVICPIPDCDSYSLSNKIVKGFALCKNNHKFCIKCNKEHKHQKCQGLPEDESATEIFYKKNLDFKKCPQCFTMQHKFRDCRTNAVKCGYELCNYEFCWLCLGRSEKTHYTNPLSSCYRLDKIDTKHVLATYNSLRMTKYFFLVLMLMLVIPFFIIFSSFLFVTFFILAFVPDGSAVRHIKMKRKGLEPIFKICVSGIYFFIAVSLIPCGYIFEASLIIVSPFLLCFKKFSNWKMEYF